MGKAQAMVLCVCNVAKLPGGPCNCPIKVSAPDRAPFVRDMLANMARAGGDPLVGPTMNVDRNASVLPNDELGLDSPEALAKYCLLTRQYLDAVAGLKISGARSADNKLRGALHDKQIELREMAWPYERQAPEPEHLGMITSNQKAVLDALPGDPTFRIQHMGIESPSLCRVCMRSPVDCKADAVHFCDGRPKRQMCGGPLGGTEDPYRVICKLEAGHRGGCGMRGDLVVSLNVSAPSPERVVEAIDSALSRARRH